MSTPCKCISFPTGRSHQWFSLAALSWVLLGLGTLRAQSTSSQTSSVASVKQRAEQLVAMTRPGYYQAMLIPDWQNLNQDRRIALTVASRFCKASRMVAVAQQTPTLQGVRQDERQIQLTWARANKLSNASMVIERSFDSNAGFEPVNWLPTSPAAGTQGQHLDNNTHTGLSYYRLSWVNAVGQPVYSPSVAIRGVEFRPSVKAFPNPGTVTSLQFEVAGQSGEAVSVMFYDGQGRTLFQNPRMELDGLGRFALPTTMALTPGRYYVRVVINEQPATTAFLVQP
ncbi:hypothetical protein GO755_38535 [Spirosoma sp. HMF4905]|uniref:T9SS type A sorting domain-containing protein n=1 Tax=Spirosoma arboris TaxID=2682092 RepID=A0A7K1SQ87_9BACT|nr:T9SS type A sorting domain-containing protein [Spirosoma arboris]MVM35975.1 hypothetical protein [Spirosoma arboris]